MSATQWGDQSLESALHLLTLTSLTPPACHPQQDGYRTLIGDGSGMPVSTALQLKLGLARALVRRPRLLLLDDADAFADAIGRTQLLGVLTRLREQQGVALLVASDRPGVFAAALGGAECQVLRIEDGALQRMSA